MIFCAEPWCNEPGRENARGTGPSRTYNKTIQALTVRHAMLGWLDAKVDPIWTDVVTTHFTKNADAISKLVNGWASTAPPAPPPAHPQRAASGTGGWEGSGASTECVCEVVWEVSEFYVRGGGVGVRMRE